MEELYSALRKAHAAGDKKSAARLTQFIQSQMGQVSEEPPEAPKVPETAGMGEAFMGGAKHMLGSMRTGVSGIFNAEEAAKEGQARQEAITEKPGASLEKVKSIYNEKGLFPAAREAISEIPSAISEQAANLGVNLVGARIGAAGGAELGALGGPYAPITVPAGTVIGGLLGAFLPNYVQQAGSNLERQAQEGKPIQGGAAYSAAVPQAALDVFTDKIMFSKLMGLPVKALGRAEADAVLAKSLKRTLAEGTAKGMVAEVPPEVAQQMLERYQAGLSLTDADARKEYADTAYQTALLGPLGAIGNVQERGEAKQVVAQDEAARAAAAAQAQRRATGTMDQQPLFTPQEAPIPAPTLDIPDVNEPAPAPISTVTPNVTPAAPAPINVTQDDQGNYVAQAPKLVSNKVEGQADLFTAKGTPSPAAKASVEAARLQGLPAQVDQLLQTPEGRMQVTKNMKDYFPNLDKTERNKIRQAIQQNTYGVEPTESVPPAEGTLTPDLLRSFGIKGGAAFDTLNGMPISNPLVQQHLQILAASSKNKAHGIAAYKILDSFGLLPPTEAAATPTQPKPTEVVHEPQTQNAQPDFFGIQPNGVSDTTQQQGTEQGMGMPVQPTEAKAQETPKPVGRGVGSNIGVSTSDTNAAGPSTSAQPSALAPAPAAAPIDFKKTSLDKAWASFNTGIAYADLSKTAKDQVRDAIKPWGNDAPYMTQDLATQIATIEKGNARGTAASKAIKVEAPLDDTQTAIPQMRDIAPLPLGAEVALVNHNIEGKTPAEAARWLGENIPNKARRLIARSVADTLERMQKAGFDTTLHVVKRGTPDGRVLGPHSRGGMGFMNDDSHRPFVILKGPSFGNDKAGTNFRTSLHELTHMATRIVISIGKRTNDPTVARLTAVANHVRAHMDAKLKSGKQLTTFEKQVLHQEGMFNNAFDDEDEFVAWTLASEDMQELMESIPYKGKQTLWSEFVTTVRSLLGIPASQNTALSEILSVSEKLLATDVKKLQRFNTDTNTAMESDSNKIDSFLNDYHKSTEAHPWDNKTRLVNGEAALQVSPQDGQIHIHDILSFAPATYNNQGLGGGSKALRLLTNLADKHGVELNLTPQAYSNKGLSDEQLHAWYSRHGFKDDEWGGMVRKPKTSNIIKEEAQAQTETPAFKKWFGDSKIVNADGSPKVAYHTTPGDFDTFNKDHAIKGFQSNLQKLGLSFVTFDKNWVNKFGFTGPDDIAMMSESPSFREALLESKQGRNIMPVFIKAEKPFDFENPNHVRHLTHTLLGLDARRVAEGDWAQLESKRVIDFLKANGYDGMYVSERGAKNLAVFEPNQIKSAVGNRGTFDASKDSIIHEIDPVAQAQANQFIAGMSGTLARSVPTQTTTATQAAQNFVATAYSNPTGALGMIENVVNQVRTKAIDKAAHLSASIQDHNDGAFYDVNNQIRADLNVSAANNSNNYINAVFTLGDMEILPDGAMHAKQGQFSVDNIFRHAKALGDRIGVEQARKLVTDAFYHYRAKAIIDNVPQDEWPENWLKDPRMVPTTAQINAAMAAFNQFPELRAMQREFIGSKNQMVRFLRKAGFLTHAKATAFLNDNSYAPWLRLKDYQDKIPGLGNMGKMVDLQQMKALVGGTEEVNDMLENMAQMIGWCVRSGISNHSANGALEAMTRIGTATRHPGRPMGGNPTHVVMTYVDGKPTFWTVDNPWDLAAFQSVKGLNSATMKVIGKWLGRLRAGIVLFPAFPLRQVVMDSQRAFVEAGVKNPWAMVGKIYKSFLSGEAFRGQHQDIQELMQYGVVGGADFTAMDTTRGRANQFGIGEKPKTITDKWVRSPAYNFLHKLAYSADLAVRLGIYRQTLEETGDKTLAATKAREIINFQKAGTSELMHTLKQTIPFLGAYLQGMDVNYRSMVGRGNSMQARKAAAAAYWGNMAMYAGLVVAYTMMMSGDDDYEDQKGFITDRNFLIPGTKLMLPVPTDVGFLAKVVPERITDYMLQEGTDSPESAKRLREGILQAFATGYLPPAAVYGVTPAVELMLNKSFFSDMPIVSQRLQGVDPQFQYTASTSELAKEIGAITGQSPLQIDYLFNAIGGTSAGALLQLADVGSSKMASDKLPIVGSFQQKTVGGRNAEEYYALREMSDRAYNTVQKLAIEQDPEKLQEYLADPKIRQLYGMHEGIESLHAQLNRVSQARNVITNNPNLSAEEKRQQVNELLAREEAALKAMPIRKLRSELE
jgi:hypothetical protein